MDHTTDEAKDVGEIRLTRSQLMSRNDGSPSLNAGWWCLPPEQALRMRLQAASTYLEQRVVPYHWGSETKRALDYTLLEKIYAQCVKVLAKSLNELHKTKNEDRYWEIISGTWLVSYISVMFDRWEIASRVLEYARGQELHELHTRAVEPPSGYVDFAHRASSSQHFNQSVLEGILFYRLTKGPPYKWKVSVDRSKKFVPKKGLPPSQLTARRFVRPLFRGALSSIIKRIDRQVALQFADRTRVLFHFSYIPKRALLRLGWELGEFPGLGRSPFEAPKSRSISAADSTRLAFKKVVTSRTPLSESEFEAFILDSLPYFTPRTLLEDYGGWLKVTKGMYPKVKIAVTANSHYGDEGFKVWAAQAVTRGVKLVIAEHGGSFPLADYLFSLQDRIADERVHSMSLIGAHYRELRAPPYLGKVKSPLEFRRRIRRVLGIAHTQLLIVPYHGSEFALRADSQPISSQWLDCAAHVVQFMNALQVGAAARIVLKEHPAAAASDINEARLISRVTTCPVSISSRSLQWELRRADLVVCTYPQTTFAEAVILGRPTVLVFDPQIHRVHPATLGLLQELETANVVFFDAAEAAEHVSEVLMYPHKWWNSVQVRAARKSFLEAMHIEADAGIEQWKSWLQSLMADQVVKRSSSVD